MKILNKLKTMMNGMCGAKKTPAQAQSSQPMHNSSTTPYAGSKPVSKDDSSSSSSGEDRMAAGASKVHKWKLGKLYLVGDKVRYHDKVYSCVVAHTGAAAMNPISATSYWMQVQV